MGGQGGPGRAVAGDDVEHAIRHPGDPAKLGKHQRRQTGKFGRLEHHRVAGGQGWSDFPGQHQQREIPWDDLADHAQRLIIGELFFGELGPAGVMIKMPGHQRDIDIARFADRLAIIQRLEHGQRPAVFLHQPRQPIENARPAMPRQGGPVRLRAARRGNRQIEIGFAALGDFGQHFTGRRIDRLEPRTRTRRHPVAVDKMAETPLVTVEPGDDRCRPLGGGAVIHRVEKFGDAHRMSPVTAAIQAIGWRLAAE